eukprot:12152360-Karenia_brevis.AAC.1
MEEGSMEEGLVERRMEAQGRVEVEELRMGGKYSQGIWERKRLLGSYAREESRQPKRNDGEVGSHEKKVPRQRPGRSLQLKELEEAEKR